MKNGWVGRIGALRQRLHVRGQLFPEIEGPVCHGRSLLLIVLSRGKNACVVNPWTELVHSDNSYTKRSKCGTNCSSVDCTTER